MGSAYWQLRAEETRTKAERMRENVARTIMFKLVKDYERLAVLAAIREKADERPRQ